MPDADYPGVDLSQQPPPELVINVAGVSRWFDDVQALTHLTIEVPKGSITVLLGPNGAGKTTAIRMITGALEPDEGAVSVFGLDPGSNEGEEVRRRCGVVSAKPSLYDRLSGWDNLRYAAELYGLGRGTGTDNRIREAAAQFGIDAALDHQVGGYSTGMKTRLALSRSVLHEPDLLLLDEPTSGLDPESAVAVLELIRDMTSQGRTVLMCTHLLLEAQGLADEVVIMQHGTSLVWGDPAELSSRYWPKAIVRLTAETGADMDRLADHAEVYSYDRSDLVATVEVDDLSVIPDLVSELATAGARLTSVAPFHPSLEDLYFAVRRDQGSAEDEIPPPPSSTGRPTRSRSAELAQ
ncbi:MAG: ABC-2 type transport system ATP-binding protein [Acidimicrobiales bacterium]|jgi:ABC-2 type transport system ATP-binding protein